MSGNGANCCCECNSCPCECPNFRLNVGSTAVTCDPCGTCNCGGFEQCLYCCANFIGDWSLGKAGGDGITSSCVYGGGFGATSFSLSYCKTTGVWTLTGTTAANWQAPNVIFPPGCRLTNNCTASFTIQSDGGQTCDGNISFTKVVKTSGTCNGQKAGVSVSPGAFVVFQGCCTGMICPMPEITLTLSADGCPCTPGKVCLSACCDCSSLLAGTYVFGPGNTSVTIPSPGDATCGCGSWCWPSPIYSPPGCNPACYFVIGILPQQYCKVNDDGSTSWGWAFNAYLNSCINWCPINPTGTFDFCGASDCGGCSVPCGSNGGPPDSGSCQLGSCFAGCTICSITGGDLSW